MAINVSSGVRLKDAQLFRQTCYVDGAWTGANAAIDVDNPATGEITKRFDPHGHDQIELALKNASSAFEKHRRSSFADRASKLQRAAEILEKERYLLVECLLNLPWSSRVTAHEMGGVTQFHRCERLVFFAFSLFAWR